MSRFGNIVLVLGSHAFPRRARSMWRKLEYKSKELSNSTDKEYLKTLLMLEKPVKRQCDMHP